MLDSRSEVELSPPRTLYTAQQYFPASPGPSHCVRMGQHATGGRNPKRCFLLKRMVSMCHHYQGSRNPPAHLANEFSVRSNLYQLMLPDAEFYPLDYPPIVRLDQSGGAT